MHWYALSRRGRVATFGVAASAALAVALGILIPGVVRHHALGARLDAIVSMVRALESGHVIPSVGEQLTGTAYAQFDSVVQKGLLGGENIRVKLWNLAGEVVYSDEPRQVGERFPIQPGLASALGGSPTVRLGELSARENLLDRAIGPRALEFYVPLRGRSGQVIGAFEIYQDSGPLESHLAAIRNVVWVSVGSGLSILSLFLALLFASTATAMAADRRTAQERAEDLAVLLRTSRLLSSEPSLDRTAPELLHVLSDRLGLRCSAVVLERSRPSFVLAREGASKVCGPVLRAAIRARREGGEVDHTGAGSPKLRHAADGGPCTALAIPVPLGDGTAGAFVACRDAARPFGSRERALVEAVAGQLAVAAANARLFAHLEEMTETRGRLLRQLVDAQEEERRHLVGELHDGVGQALTRVLYGLRGSRARLDPAETEVAAELSKLESLTNGLIGDVRRYMAEIGPAILEDFGLPHALRAFAREQEQETSLRIDVRVDAVPPLEPAAAITLYRAAQEAVMNARKHAGAHHVEIDLVRRDGSILLLVADDGRGAADIRDGIGLTYMKERAASLGGRVDVVSRPGAGTTVRVLVPSEAGHGSRSGRRGG